MMQDLALRLAPAAASVANFCDHIEHNEYADRAWVEDAAVVFREAALDLAMAAGIDLKTAYAARLREIEACNLLQGPGAYDGARAARDAATLRQLQLVQFAHDRHYHPDVIGLARTDQLRHIALHLAKIVGAFAEPRSDDEILRRRLPDVLLFSIKLATVMNCRLPETELVPTSADRTE